MNLSLAASFQLFNLDKHFSNFTETTLVINRRVGKTIVHR